MNRTRAGAMQMLDSVLIKVLSGEPEGYSVIFTEYYNPYKEPCKRRGPISEVFKDILNGEHSNGIGKDVIFETPSECMSILREFIGRELPRIKIQDYDLSMPIRINTSDGGIIEYLHPVIVIKK